jgi:predicted Zn-ribbon and HTH transcriptional regulator
MGWIESIIDVEEGRPEYTVADVLRLHWEEYRARYGATREQVKAALAMMACRTAALGGYVKICSDCGYVEFSYKSCKNRACPTCGAFERAEWLEERKLVVLPIEYFHTVFTIDHAILPLLKANASVIYNLMFEASGETLKAYGQKYLGGEIGFTGVLHTWGETLILHPHIHYTVTGGAQTKDAEGHYGWHSAKPGYLFPVVALSRDYRERVCEGLLKLWQKGELKLEGECAEMDIEALVAEMRGKAWEVFIKPAHGAGEKVFEYQARYFNRVAISNYRIVAIGNGTVTFKYHDNRAGGQEKLMTLDGVEFIRRFMLHILPARFVRVRHYPQDAVRGLHHPNKRKDLQRCRALLGLPYSLPVVKQLIMLEWLAQILGDHPNRCPRCGGVMSTWGKLDELSPLVLWVMVWLLRLTQRRA